MQNLEILRKDNLFKVVCRPALPRDTAEVVEFTRTIWEGEDYIPDVWAEWLAEPEGLLAVAEFGGKVVGISKLTRLSSNQWWLEGLRVHPSFEGQGIASRLHDYLLEVWERTGAGSIRLVTASFRKPVHHLAQRTGFIQVSELTLYTAEADILQTSDPFKIVQGNEILQVLEFIESSETFNLANRLIDLGWQWASLELEFISEAVQHKRVWWWRERAGLLITREEEEDHGTTSMIQLLACTEEDVSRCLFDLRRMGSKPGSSRVGWFVLPNQVLIRGLEQAGYHRSWEASLYLFEKK